MGRFLPLRRRVAPARRAGMVVVPGPAFNSRPPAHSAIRVSVNSPDRMRGYWPFLGRSNHWQPTVARRAATVCNPGMPRPHNPEESGPPPSLPVQFGYRLRGIREETGLSQERFAHICGLDRAYVGNIERGRKNPSLITIVRLAAGLGIDPAELVRGMKPDE